MKRKHANAWEAVAASRSAVYATSRTRTDSSPHLTRVTTDVVVPSSPPPPPPPPNPQSPLVVSAADVASARHSLGLPPAAVLTPSASPSVFISPSAAAAARALLSSTRRAHRPDRDEEDDDDDEDENGSANANPNKRRQSQTNAAHTPAANPRLSTASAVTPLALNFESPTIDRHLTTHPPQHSQHSQQQQQQQQQQNQQPPPQQPPQPQQQQQQQKQQQLQNHHHSNHHANLSPITPATARRQSTDSDRHSGTSLFAPAKPLPAAPAASLFASVREPLFTTAAMPAPVLAVPEKMPGDTTAPHSLFTTGSGHTIPIPANANIAESLFTTANGKAVPIPANTPGAANIAESLFTTGSGKAVRVPPQTTAGANIAKSLFTTGSGKTVPIPPKTPSTANIAESVFTTGSGKTVPIPPKASGHSNLAESLFTTGNGNTVPIPPKAPGTANIADSLFTTGSGKTVPIPPKTPGATDIAESLFTTGSGKTVPVPPKTPGATNIAESLFTTGSGKTVPVPPKTPGAANISESLFSTGSGKTVPVPPKTPGRANLAESLFTTGNGDRVAVAPKTPGAANLADSLFSTGSGRSIPVNPRRLAFDLPEAGPGSGGWSGEIPRGQLIDEAPAALVTPQHKFKFAKTSAASSASGLSARRQSITPVQGSKTPLGFTAFIERAGSNALLTSASSLRRTSASSSAGRSSVGRDPECLLNGLVTPTARTPNSAVNLRKALFNDSSKKQHGGGGATDYTTSRRSSGGGGGSSIKNTPFKRPRAIAKPKETPGAATSSAAKDRVNTTIASFDVGRYRRDGSLLPSDDNALQQACGNTIPPPNCQPLSPPPPEKLRQLDVIATSLLSPGCLTKCFQYTFPEWQFGCVVHVPASARSMLDAGRFGADDAVAWVRKLFDERQRHAAAALADKPVTAAGSSAWARLAYALAVFKLAVLQRRHTKGAQFLTAGNVMREVMRRVNVEWHQSRQPGLLRMLRRDASPASHAVLRVADVRADKRGKGDGVHVLLTDGWYVAAASLDAPLRRRVLSGWARIGDALHICGASLVDVGAAERDDYPWFFGDADEMGDHALKLHKNGVLRARDDSASDGNKSPRLGVRRTAPARSLRWPVPGGGPVPAATVAVLRAYPAIYMERRGDDVVWLREEAEVEQRRIVLERRRKRAEARHFRGDGAEERKEDQGEEEEEEEERDVTCVQDVLVRGVDDSDNGDDEGRGTVVLRVYRIGEDVLRAPCVLHVRGVLPKPRGAPWTVKGDGVWAATTTAQNSGVGVGFATLKRVVADVTALTNESVRRGTDFDAALYVLHADARFVYCTDMAGRAVVALELCAADQAWRPRALRPGSVVAARDLRFDGRDASHDVVQASSTLRSAFSAVKHSPHTPPAQGPPADAISDDVISWARQLAAHVAQPAAAAHLDVVADAVVSFATGRSASIADYFSNSQSQQSGPTASAP